MIMSLILEVEGVTELNKHRVCQSVADALEAIVLYCSLNGPSTSRRRLEVREVYTDLAVVDTDVVFWKLQATTFLVSLENLPENVTVSDITMDDGQGTKFKFKDGFQRRYNIIFSRILILFDSEMPKER